MNRINSSRDITVDDFKDSLRNTSVERIPFNQNFHDEFQNELLKNKDKKKDYESKAFHLLHEANNLINGGHYAAATLRASTALEVMLDGFLIESGIVTKKELDLEGHSLKYKMNDLFNKAVRNGKNHGKKYDLFDPRLKKKIIDIRKKPGNGIELEEISTLHNIRNTETHEGGTEKVNSNDYYLSKIAVSSYAEAVSYVINQGWNNNSKVNLQSEALTWVCRHLRDRVQQVPDNQVKDMLKRDLKKVFNYLQPMEIEKLNKQVDETSWAYEIFKKSK